MSVQKYYSTSVLCPATQFTYGGEASCTYCSIESCIYFLHGFVQEGIVNRNVPDVILRGGVGMDRKVGHTSADECHQKNDRFKQQLICGNIIQGRVTSENSFLHLMQKMKEQGKQGRVAYVLTKPPETIALMYNPYSKKFPFIIYDSHPRPWQKGSGFYFFAAETYVNYHLKMIFRAFTFPGQNSYQVVSHSMFEATRLVLKHRVQFVQVEEFYNTKRLSDQMRKQLQMREPTAPINPIPIESPKPQHQPQPQQKKVQPKKAPQLSIPKHQKSQKQATTVAAVPAVAKCKPQSKEKILIKQLTGSIKEFKRVIDSQQASLQKKNLELKKKDEEIAKLKAQLQTLKSHVLEICED